MATKLFIVALLVFNFGYATEISDPRLRAISEEFAQTLRSQITNYEELSPLQEQEKILNSHLLTFSNLKLDALYYLKDSMQTQQYLFLIESTLQDFCKANDLAVKGAKNKLTVEEREEINESFLELRDNATQSLNNLPYPPQLSYLKFSGLFDFKLLRGKNDEINQLDLSTEQSANDYKEITCNFIELISNFRSSIEKECLSLIPLMAENIRLSENKKEHIEIVLGKIAQMLQEIEGNSVLLNHIQEFKKYLNIVPLEQGVK